MSITLKDVISNWIKEHYNGQPFTIVEYKQWHLLLYEDAYVLTITDAYISSHFYEKPGLEVTILYPHDVGFFETLAIRINDTITKHLTIRLNKRAEL